MADLLYLIPIAMLLYLELTAAFKRSPPAWHTITWLTQSFEKRRWVYRFVIGCLVALEFTHLVLFWP